MIEPKRIEAAARPIYNAGIHHGWWQPRDVSFEQFKVDDPIGFSEFLAIVADSLAAAYPELASDPPTAWVAPWEATEAMAEAQAGQWWFGFDDRWAAARDAHTKEQT